MDNVMPMNVDNVIVDDAMPLTITDDEFKPSPMRFLVAALLCVSSALSGYILQTYVTIW